MQVLTVGMFRKAALVKRQTLCGGEYWELDSSPASGTWWGVGTVCCPGVSVSPQPLVVALFSASAPGAAEMR